LGSQELRNIPSPVEVYRVEPSEGRVPEEEAPHPFDVSRVAVLPLVNLSSVAGDDFFADGMTGELIYTLSRIPGLKVIAQTSVMKYKGARASVGEIARDLRVGTVLEGSVRKAGEQVRITLQLIDVASEGLLWSEAFDREVKDVFAVQSDIARRVADALQVRFQAAERQRLSRQAPGNVQAYMRYLQGRSFWNMRTEKAVRKAIECFEEAIEMDPDFALAYVGIADCYVIMADWGYMTQAEGFGKAREAALKALELDDTLAEPHASLAITIAGLDGDYPKARAEMEVALELNPNYATGRHWHAMLLLRMGDLQGAVEEGSRAVELDPLAPVIATEYGEMLAMAGRFNEAEQQFHRTLELNPGFTGARCALAKVLQQTWRWERAEGVLRRAVELDPGFARAHADLGMLFVITGRTEQGVSELREAVRLAPDNAAVSHALALALLFTGATDEALIQAQQTVEKNPTFEPGLISLALSYAARGDFQEALREIRKADQLVERGYRLLDEDTALGQAVVFRWMGRPEEARGVMNRLASQEEGPNKMFVTAVIHFLLGELEEGFAALERSLQRREASLRLLGLLPLPDEVRTDSRYHAAMVRIGLAD
ncbi:MAG: tetratricopeptide repeat protein, partial [Candidatus Bipolaricaulota bacterium]